MMLHLLTKYLKELTRSVYDGEVIITTLRVVLHVKIHQAKGNGSRQIGRLKCPLTGGIVRVGCGVIR